MAIYNVVMNEGVTVANLDGHTLMTGHGDAGDKIQTCSAVTMVNTGNWRAGLYHFPAGSINADDQSAGLLNAMRDAVAPTEAYVHWGVAAFQQAELFPVMAGQMLEEATTWGEQLRAFVLRLLPLESRLRRMPAKSGIITVRKVGNRVEFGNTDIDPTHDLRDTDHNPDGNPAVYWKANY